METPIADVIYLTGYYDRPDNHLPEMKARAQQGFRVISFAYPSHDENKGSYNSLSRHTFKSLFQMIHEIEKATRIDVSRPLALEGWSLGGELIVRFMQKKEHTKMGRSIFALVLQAPSVSVYPLVGECGVPTRRTLTSNKDYQFGGELKPSCPMIHWPFTLRLVGNGILSFWSRMPKNIPVFVQLAGRDKYVSSSGVRRWVRKQVKKGASIEVKEYPEALHMLTADDPTAVTDAGEFLVENLKTLPIN